MASAYINTYYPAASASWSAPSSSGCFHGGGFPWPIQWVTHDHHHYHHAPKTAKEEEKERQENFNRTMGVIALVVSAGFSYLLGNSFKRYGEVQEGISSSTGGTLQMKFFIKEQNRVLRDLFLRTAMVALGVLVMSGWLMTASLLVNTGTLCGGVTLLFLMFSWGLSPSRKEVQREAGISS